MNSRIYYSIVLTVLAVCGPVFASDVAEVEPNDTVATAQPIVIPNEGVTISGLIGTGSGVTQDTDFYTFFAQAGDTFTFDINADSMVLDTIMVVYGPGPVFALKRINDDEDPNAGITDSKISDFVVDVTGNYTVGVTTVDNNFLDGGVVTLGSNIGNGPYQLVITRPGVTPTPTPTPDPTPAPAPAPPPQVQPLKINIDIRPGDRHLARIEPYSKHNIPVALLSSSEFNAATVDPASITFGATGDERSLSHCLPPRDVNHDGILDLVCLFKNDVAGFQRGDLEGILRGKADKGRAFEGRDALKVIAQKHYGYERHHDGHR